MPPPHHPVFSNFEPFKVDIPAGVGLDLVGATIRSQFVAGITTYAAGPTLTPDPLFDEEYFEWIDLLESVVEARGSYTMIELGAGFGRWVVRAGLAVRRYHGEMPFRLMAVEGEPVTFQWMRLHFKDNGIDPNQHSLIHGAISGVPGKVMFYIGGPRGGAFDRNFNNWYGQALTKDYDVASTYTDDGQYNGFRVWRHASGWRSIQISGLTLASLLKDLDLVDLIDMDIEGQELSVIKSSIEDLNAKVKRLHIGTHGKEIEDELRRLLSSHNWNCLADYSLLTTSDTPWGAISFENGVQSWVNPRLRS